MKNTTYIAPAINIVCIDPTTFIAESPTPLMLGKTNGIGFTMGVRGECDLSFDDEDD